MIYNPINMLKVIYESKNLLGNTPSTIKLKSIKRFLKKYRKYNVDAGYQRELCWTEESMCNLIKAIMDNAFIPPLLIYKYHKTNPEYAYYKFEVNDGQHRMFSLKAFKDSKWVNIPNKNKPILIRWKIPNPEDNRSIINVFYKETEDTKEWKEQHPEQTVCYLDDEGRRKFDEKELIVSIIKGNLTYDQRREIFDNLQNGEKNRNSDLLKNKRNCPFIVFITDNNYKSLFYEKFFKICTKRAKKYWVNWAGRFYLIYKAALTHDKQQITNAFVYGDSQIKNDILRNSIKLSAEDYQDFHNNIIRYFNFLTEQGVKLNPTQAFCLFVPFCLASGFETILSTHMTSFSREGSAKDSNSMWEHNETDIRREYFMKVYDQINDNMIMIALPEYDDTPISSELKLRVWQKCFKNKKRSVCPCGEKISINKHDCGHIIARALNGQTEESNLISICSDCNKRMGTRNAVDWYLSHNGVDIRVYYDRY